MALLGFWGFDDAVAEPGASNGKGTTGRAGGVGSSSANVVNLSIPNASEIFFGIAYKLSSNVSGIMCKLVEGAITHLQLGFNATNQITITNGSGTVLATSTATVDLTSWPYIEVHVVIADTGGSCEVRANETAIVSYTGDTRNGGTGVVNQITWQRPASAVINLDDGYALDTTGSAPYNTYLGDIKVLALLPSGDGDSSGWLGSDGNSTNNSLLVDEADSSMTDYVAASVSGTLDLYVMADVPAGYDVLAIQEVVYAQASDAGTPPVVLPVAKGALGTVRADSALPDLGTTAGVRASDIRTTDPDGNALTAARVNAMQVGVKIQ